MKCQEYLVSIAILASVIQNGECGKNVYCHASKNEYFLPVGNMCKKCDKCMPGLELVSDKEANFEISKDHGAQGCKHCVVCKEGYYNTKWTYRGCRKCKNCGKKGKETVKACTATNNAECGRKLKTETSVSNTPMEYTGISTTESVKLIKIVAANHISGGSKYFIGVIVVGTLLILAFVVCIIFTAAKYFPFRIYTENLTRRNNPTGLDNVEVSDNEEDGETSPFTSCFNSTKTKYDIIKDYESPTEKQLIFISKRIATRKSYWQLGVHLEVGENNISIIEYENQNDLIRISFKMLQKWTYMFAEQATISRLLDALQALERNDIVEDFYLEFKSIFCCNHTLTAMALNKNDGPLWAESPKRHV